MAGGGDSNPGGVSNPLVTCKKWESLIPSRQVNCEERGEVWDPENKSSQGDAKRSGVFA